MPANLIPTERELRHIEQQREQERQMIEGNPAFAGVAEAIVNTADPAVRRDIPIPANLSETQMQAAMDCKQILDQFYDLGIQGATVLNMHPWTLQASGPCHDGREIDACPIGQEYVRYVFDSPAVNRGVVAIDMADRGGTFKASAIFPIKLAEDFVRQHDFAQGGLVCYLGTHLPGRNRNSVVNEAEKARFVSARERQTAFYHKLLDEASMAAQNGPTGMRNIHKNHRAAIRWLHYHKQITELPKWISEKIPGVSKTVVCSKCGEEVNPKGYACAKCHNITNPFLAYQTGALEIETPGAMLALRQLSKEQLTELGIYGNGEGLVLPLDEYRAQKAKERKKAEKAGGKAE